MQNIYRQNFKLGNKETLTELNPQSDLEPIILCQKDNRIHK
jgi:hypothetical protein